MSRPPDSTSTSRTSARRRARIASPISPTTSTASCAAACARSAKLTGEPTINLVGYCLGGTLSLLYAALYPETVRRLVLLTTTVDGDVEGGIAWVAHKMGLAGESYDDPRLVPAVEVKSWFEMLAPGSNSVVGRVNDLWERLDDEPERLRDVRTMATWVDDVVPASGRLLAELYQKFGPGRNSLDEGHGDGRRPHARLRRGVYAP